MTQNKPIAGEGDDNVFQFLIRDKLGLHIKTIKA